MITCRIISVNAEDSDVKKSVQDFGHQKDGDGNKLRYLNRRKKIKEFVENTTLPGIEFKIFDAITPKDFIKLGDDVLFNGKLMKSATESLFYIANNLSHYQIWNINEDTLIVEDDLLFDPIKFIFTVGLIEKFENIKFSAKVLYLQGTHPSIPGAVNKNLVGINCGYLEFQTPLMNNDDLSGTGAYFIKKEAKRMLLNNMKPLCACDKFMDDYYKEGLIQWFIPKNRELMLSLDKETLVL